MICQSEDPKQPAGEPPWVTWTRHAAWSVLIAGGTSVATELGKWAVEKMRERNRGK